MEFILLPFILVYYYFFPYECQDVKISAKGRKVMNDPVLLDKFYRAIQEMRRTGERSATVDGLTVKY